MVCPIEQVTSVPVVSSNPNGLNQYHSDNNFGKEDVDRKLPPGYLLPKDVQSNVLTKN
jgi:hypothetical protein